MGDDCIRSNVNFREKHSRMVKSEAEPLVVVDGLEILIIRSKVDSVGKVLYMF